MDSLNDILIIDDDADIVNLVVDLLQDEGYSVRTAANGEAALDLIAQQPPALILMDMYMPHMTGSMLLEKLRSSQSAAIPVIMMTGSSRASHPEIEAYQVEYLAKPFDIDDLLGCVARYVPAAGNAYIEQGRYINQSV